MSGFELYLVIGGIAFALFVVIALFSSAYTIEQQTVGVIQRFGKFHKLAQAGLGFKVPLIDSVAARVSLKIGANKVKVETKTHDNVFVHLPVVVQYQVIPDRVYDAHYKLADADGQIDAFISDVVRAEVPKLTLDQAFESKDHIANAVKTNLAGHMDDYGYQILTVQVLDVEPNELVKNAMNKINEAQRLQIAAQAQAEADKIRLVKAAEAEAESKALQGRGIADQRHAIIKGLHDSIKEFQAAIPGSSPNQVMQLVMLAQYFDMLKDAAHNSGTRTIFLPSGPNGMTEISQQIQQAMLVSNEANPSTPAPEKAE
jgi:regulator of protease activity HflC (stomatin/prohibitin superfamily)